jgi:phosphinothricin acetyltransferase
MNPPRLANKADAPAMVEILNYYIAHSTTTFLIEPQTLEDRLSWFDQRSEIHPAIAVEIEGEVIAWGALSTHNPRGGYRHTADVSVYVHPDFQRRGVGRMIITDLISRVRAIGHHVLVANCCTESVASIALHESLGFSRAGHLREIGRKFDRWLDTVYLLLPL